MPPRLTDERLCWLAVVDTLRARRPSVRWIFTGCGVFAAGAALYAARNLILGPDHGRWFLPLLPLSALVGTVFMIRGVVSAKNMNSKRMMQYSLAVKNASEKLSDEERMRLRAEGSVPHWFLGEVEHRRKAVKF